MKRLLLILMTLASVAMADDAKMTKLIVGTWAWVKKTTIPGTPHLRQTARC